MKALQLIEICQKFAEHVSDTTSDTFSRSISPFAEADDKEKSDEVTGKTSQGQGQPRSPKKEPGCEVGSRWVGWVQKKFDETFAT